MPKFIKKGKAIIDYRFPHANEYHIYESKNNIYTCTLNQTNIKDNNNKFYIMQLAESDGTPHEYYLFTIYGRVGYKGISNSKELSSVTEGISLFCKIFKTKTGNNWYDRKNFKKKVKKYYLCEIEYEENPTTDNKISIPKSKLDPRLLSTLELISDTKVMTKTMLSLNIDVKKMPLGKISKKQIKDAYAILKNLTNKLTILTTDEINVQSSMFYTLIPYACGMHTPPLINNQQIIQKHSNMLNNLSDIQIASEIISGSKGIDKHPLDQIYEKLNCQLIIIDPKKHAKTYKLLEKYVLNTHATSHSRYTLDVLDIFKVSRPDEAERYNIFTKNIDNKRLLWHGSRLSNWMGILSQGLRIFPTASVGSMFGRAVYLASSVSKSANYCFADRTHNIGYLILCETALGNMWELLHAKFVTKPLPDGCHSVWGCGKSTPDPKEFKTTKSGITIPCGHMISSGINGSLLYDEHMVYNEEQVKISYLIKIRFNYKY